MRDFKNPKSYWGRFLANFALSYSAWLVVMLIVWTLGRWDVLMAFMSSLLFSALFAAIRAGISKPGTSFWRSPLKE